MHWQCFSCNHENSHSPNEITTEITCTKCGSPNQIEITDYNWQVSLYQGRQSNIEGKNEPPEYNGKLQEHYHNKLLELASNFESIHHAADQVLTLLGLMVTAIVALIGIQQRQMPTIVLQDIVTFILIVLLLIFAFLFMARQAPYKESIAPILELMSKQVQNSTRWSFWKGTYSLWQRVDGLENRIGVNYRRLVKLLILGLLLGLLWCFEKQTFDRLLIWVAWLFILSVCAFTSLLVQMPVVEASKIHESKRTIERIQKRKVALVWTSLLYLFLSVTMSIVVAFML